MFPRGAREQVMLIVMSMIQGRPTRDVGASELFLPATEREGGRDREREPEPERNENDDVLLKG